MMIRSLSGDEFIMQATTTNNNESNGSQSLEGVIDYNVVNKTFIHDIDKYWTIYDQKDVAYKVILLTKKGNGDKLTVNFKATPLFFDHMTSRSMMESKNMHYKYNGSLTARNAFNKIFEGEPFDYVLVDSFTSKDWETFGGGENKLKSFTRALNRYGAEFYIEGSTVFIKKLIGRDTNIMYRYRLNADNITQEIDATEQITAIVGYGNFGDSQADEGSEEDYQDARLIREYISPIAHLVDDKIRWGFFEDGRIKNTKVMDDTLKKIVEESLEVSVTADIINLRDQGYPIDESMAGDRVFLTDERIGFDQEVRIKSQSITRDWKGKIINASISFGSQSLSQRYQSDINTTMKDAAGLAAAFGEDKVIPLSFMSRRVKEVTAIINGNTNSSFKYMDNGVWGQNRTDANYVTRYVDDALAFSKDGGSTWSTFMSARYGINADFITAGELRGINIYQESNVGSVAIENGEIESYIGGKKAMKWGGWKQEFYNPDGSLIGTLEPTRLLNRDNYGISLTVTDDFLTIGHWVGGQRRPVFRTQELDGNKSTYVLGPYDARGSNNSTEVVLGANSNIGLAAGGKYERNQQASLILRNKPQEEFGNSASLYFGGISKYAGQQFDIRANINGNESKQVAVFRQNEIRLETRRVIFGGTSARIENFDDGIYVFSSGDARSGLRLWHGGQVDIMSRGSDIHKFYSDGTKSGGSIEVNGTRLGMSPVDSPQTLIEYIEFNISVENKKKVYLDKNYVKSVGSYAVFSSNRDIKIIEKHTDYFVISGKGVTDFRIVGKRIKYDDAFWNDMQPVEKGA